MTWPRKSNDMPAPAVGGGSATGGTITTSGLYTYHAFKSGSDTFVTPAGMSKTGEALLVAGGGSEWWGGGGGAGGLIYGTFAISGVGSWSVTVGAAPSYGANGGDSTMTGMTTAQGGGYGTVGGGCGGGGCAPDEFGDGWGYGAGGTQGGAGGNGNASWGGGGGGMGGAGGTPYWGGAGVNTYSVWAAATGTGSAGYYCHGMQADGGGVGGVNTGDGGCSGVVIIRYLT